jgi:DNA polymerase I-like protein with 3'-5' exonuclease and polymerase domains
MPLSATLPNVRKLFITDPGYVMYEADLMGADAQVVAWEADDADLKSAFRTGVDVHCKNAEDMWGKEFTKLGHDSHAYKQKRQECKHTVHGINYGCTPRTTAIQRGWTVKDAERFHTNWLTLHPGIAKWHNHVKTCLETNRTITNAFGFRRVFFDRLDNCFTEALAWIPQSTVALNTYYGAIQLESKYWPEQLAWDFVPSNTNFSGLILQTHDSLNFQFPTQEAPKTEEIETTLQVKTPYADPLYIPWDLKCSTKSWGEMAKPESG